MKHIITVWGVNNLIKLKEEYKKEDIEEAWEEWDKEINFLKHLGIPDKDDKLQLEISTLEEYFELVKNLEELTEEFEIYNYGSILKLYF